MRTPKEIQNEIRALKALKPVGIFRHRTTHWIGLIIEELSEGIDDTAGEWNELSEDDQRIVLDARRWKEGDTHQDRPSEGWGKLVARKNPNSPAKLPLPRRTVACVKRFNALIMRRRM